MYKQRLYRGLINIDTYHVDNSSTSPQYFNFDVLPTELTSGKNALWIVGSNKFISETPIQIEILDNSGIPLYHEVTSVVDNINRRLISVWVQSINHRGIGSITVIAELKPEYVPIEWVEKYNVKWTRDIFIDPFKQNHTQISFGSVPRIFISGFKTTSKEVSPANLIFDSQHRIASASLVKFTKKGNIGYYPDLDQPLIKSQNFGESSIWTQLSSTESDSSITVKGNVAEIKSSTNDTINGYAIESSDSEYMIESDAPIFTSNMNGGIINIPYPVSASPAYNSTYTVNNAVPQMYSSKIRSVINSKTILTDSPYTIGLFNGNTPITHTYTKFSPSSCSVTYSFSNDDIQYLTSSLVPKLSVDIQFANVELLSGDIHKIKTFAKRRNIDVDYQLMTELNLNPQELLVDPFYPNQTTFLNVGVNKRLLGIFRVESDITQYWTSESFGAGNIIRSCSLSPHLMVDSITISPWLSSSIPAIARDNHVIISPRLFTTVIEGSILTLSGKFACSYDSESMTYPMMELFGSGSACYTSRPGYSVTSDYVSHGKYIGTISSTQDYQYFGKVNFPVTVDRDGYIKPVFKIKGGKWTMSELSLKPAEEFGFTPNNFSFNVALPYDISSSVDLKFEYYSYNGEQSSYTSYLNNILLKTQYQSKQYYDESQQPITKSSLFVPPSFTSSSFAQLHQFNLNQNVQTIKGIIDAVRKSDIYTRSAYVSLITTRSSSRYEQLDNGPIPVD